MAAAALWLTPRTRQLKGTRHTSVSDKRGGACDRLADRRRHKFLGCEKQEMCGRVVELPATPTRAPSVVSWSTRALSLLFAQYPLATAAAPALH